MTPIASTEATPRLEHVSKYSKQTIENIDAFVKKNTAGGVFGRIKAAYNLSDVEDLRKELTLSLLMVESFQGQLAALHLPQCAGS